MYKYITPYSEISTEEKKSQRAQRRFMRSISAISLFAFLSIAGYISFQAYTRFDLPTQITLAPNTSSAKTVPTATITEYFDQLVLNWKPIQKPDFIHSVIIFNETKFPSTPKDGELLGISSTGEYAIDRNKKGYLTIFNLYTENKITVAAQAQTTQY